MQQLLSDGPLGEIANHCQLVYTFVVGGNPNGPKELIDFNASYPLTVETPLFPDEQDVTYLNIEENMKEGKSQTWLKYAMGIIENHYYFDDIGKGGPGFA